MAAVSLTDIHPLEALLVHRPLGLFSDIDGTLAPIVPRPEDAQVTPMCRRLLEALMDCGVKVALVTGRTLEEAKAMIGLDSAAYGASHGLELRVSGWPENHRDLAEYRLWVEDVVRDARGLGEAGVSAEVKAAGVAFHYRRAEDEGRARTAILNMIEASDAARRFKVTEGRKVIELRPALEVNKGTATRYLAERLGVRALVCIGDDLTDVDMFLAARTLADEGLPAATVAVRSNESPQELPAAADYSVDGVEGVEWLLAELLRAVGGTSP